MKKIGLFYGTTSGKTKRIAELIEKEFGKKNIDLYNIRDIEPLKILEYDNIILGTSAWGVGDMQDDWEQLIDEIVDLDFSGKKISLFGLGDQFEYPGSFADALGTLYCRLPVKDQIVGFMPTTGFKYYFSSAEKNGEFVGLVINEDKQAELSSARVKQWVALLKKAFV